MGGWRTKSTFMLIVFFTGFATAIYALSSSAKGGETATAAIKSQTTVLADESRSKIEEFIMKFKPRIEGYFKLAKERSEQLTKAMEK